MAQKLGKTVAELRTGEPQPLSNDEFIRWAIFYGRKRQRENQKVVASSGTGRPDQG